jgi:hypothetical protein
MTGTTKVPLEIRVDWDDDVSVQLHEFGCLEYLKMS